MNVKIQQAIASLVRGLIVAGAVWWLDGPTWAIVGLALVAFYEHAGDIE